jgi:hypothetical protein
MNYNISKLLYQYKLEYKFVILNRFIMKSRTILAVIACLIVSCQSNIGILVDYDEYTVATFKCMAGSGVANVMLGIDS